MDRRNFETGAIETHNGHISAKRLVAATMAIGGFATSALGFSLEALDRLATSEAMPDKLAAVMTLGGAALGYLGWKGSEK